MRAFALPDVDCRVAVWAPVVRRPSESKVILAGVEAENEIPEGSVSRVPTGVVPGQFTCIVLVLTMLNLPAAFRLIAFIRASISLLATRAAALSSRCDSSVRET